MSYTISCICIILAGLCNRNCQDKNRIFILFLLFFMILLMFGTYMVSICTKKMSSFKTSIMGILVSILGFMILYAFQTVPTFFNWSGFS